MIITSTVYRDLSRCLTPATVDVTQDDKCSRSIAFQLYENTVPWIPPDGATAIVRYLKPDGTGGSYDMLPDGSAACVITDNVLTVALAPQVCTVPGIVRLTAALIDGEAELHVFTIHVHVHKNPGLQATSEGYYNVRGSLPDAGWPANMFLGTDADGNVVAVEIPKSGVQTVNGTAPDADGNVDVAGVPLPASARVGQFLQVTEVSDTGKITGVKAVDLDAEVVATCLYNGVELPVLPEWDKEKHPYATMHQSPQSGKYYLYLMSQYIQLTGSRGGIVAKDRAVYNLTDSEWVYSHDSVLYMSMYYEPDGDDDANVVDFVWASFDLLNPDGSVYMAASDPIPVYPAKEESGGGLPVFAYTVTAAESTPLTAEESAVLTAYADARMPFILHLDVPDDGSQLALVTTLNEVSGQMREYTAFSIVHGTSLLITFAYNYDDGLWRFDFTAA